jgi:predicted tellurium resistance membrane protein TerC
MLKRILLTMIIALAGLRMQAADAMEEYFYESGKIKVVIGVAFIVMVGLIAYIWRLDRRVTRMEEQQKGGKS